ncbi:MAG: ECF-type sigma factor, partial [Planctomycetota bacterium]
MATTTPTAGRSVPELLRAWRGGSATAHGELFARLHRELRALARRRLANEAEGHTLSPTALVHDAFVRLQGAAPACADGAQFFALVATVMRRALVDGARRRRARRAALAAAAAQAPGDDVARDDRVLRLDTALERLQRVDPALH